TLSVGFSIPQIFLLVKKPSDYVPFTSNLKLSFFEEETYIYAAHVRRIDEGYLNGDPYLWEYKNSSSPYIEELGSYMPLWISSKIAGSVSAGFVLSEFIFPPLLFLLIFYSLKKFKYKTYFAIAASLAVIIIPFFSTLIPLPFHDSTRWWGSSNLPVFFTRIPHPLISSVYLFTPLFFTAAFLTSPAPYMFYLFPLLMGIVLYSSPFIASSVIIGSLILTPALIKKFTFKKLVLSAFIFLLCALPLLLNALSFQKLIDTKDFLVRTSFPLHFMFPVQLRYLFIGSFLFLLRRDKFSAVILSYITAASILIDGHQLLLGRNLEADHWVSRIMAPLATLSIFLSIHFFIKKLRFSNIIWIVFSVILIGILFIKQYSWIKERINEFPLAIKEEEALNQIIKNTKEEDVIGSFDYNLNKYLTGMTGRRVYLASGDRTLASTTEQLRRICDLSNIIKSKDRQYIKRINLDYALGFDVWYKDDLSDIIQKIENCRKENFEGPKYKLDYILQENEEQGFDLIPISRDLP
ncbi:MAG: hypothetical protein COU81_02925, partial [Candidatus Portnoybacteria bacterium CG10_big_fil_rev_8_21_14_0_10_36_7]